MLFAALPLPVCLVAVCLAGMALGGLVNWAVYRLAWNWREITPWGPTPEGASRTWADRIPVIGWLRLRREHELHGRGFWLRPLAIELLMGVGLAALYWWEVACQGLVFPQVETIVAGVAPVHLPVVSGGLTHAIFLGHLVLIVFLAAASFIDIDEKIIPDEVTVPGTLLGLVLAALLPEAMLAHVEERPAPPIIGELIALPPQLAGVNLYAEPMTLVAPNAWADKLNTWHGLVLGLACWWLWCFAVAPRTWRGRRGMVTGMKMILRRFARELMREPLGPIAWIVSAVIVAVWWFMPLGWVGLLSALVGMAACGGMIWVVRLVGTAALGREAMGFGDVTLMFMVGTFLGWQACVIVFFVAPFPALVIGIVQLLRHDDDMIPYGPSLSMGTVAVATMWPKFWSFGLQSIFGVGWLMPAVIAGSFALLGIMLVVWQRIKLAIFGRREYE